MLHEPGDKQERNGVNGVIRGGLHFLNKGGSPKFILILEGLWYFAKFGNPGLGIRLEALLTFLTMGAILIYVSQSNTRVT